MVAMGSNIMGIHNMGNKAAMDSINNTVNKDIVVDFSNMAGSRDTLSKTIHSNTNNLSNHSSSRSMSHQINDRLP